MKQKSGEVWRKKEAGGRHHQFPCLWFMLPVTATCEEHQFSELFQMALLMEGVSLPPWGRIYSQCSSAVTASGKSRTGAMSLSTEWPFLHAWHWHLPSSPIHPEHSLGITPCYVHQRLLLQVCFFPHSRKIADYSGWFPSICLRNMWITEPNVCYHTGRKDIKSRPSHNVSWLCREWHTVCTVLEPTLLF